MTPDALALTIVRHFRPCGRILEPCAGEKAFVHAMKDCDYCDWMEIDNGRDFLAENINYMGRRHWDWIVTNPPWSQFRDFLDKSMQRADNIVFLCLINAWFMTARQRDIRTAGFGLVEVLQVPTPPKPWPQAGFALGAGWLRRGWQGGTTWSVVEKEGEV